MTDLAYIMSPSYCGSTLLTFLLGTHPDVATVGELKATSMGDIEQYDCSCGRRIRQCPFWRQVQDELARRGIPFDLADFGTDFRLPDAAIANRLIRTALRGRAFEAARDLAIALIPPCRTAVKRIVEKNKALIDVIKPLQNAAVFLDGSKDPVRLKYLLDSRLWNIKVINLIRDGRGAAASFMKHYNIPMKQAAREWRHAQRQCDRMAERLPNNACMTVHYERLCLEPQELLAAICDFLGLDSRQIRCDFRSVEQHVIGNYMRLSSADQIVLDEKWKTRLTADDLADFDRIAGELNRRYGYQ